MADETGRDHFLRAYSLTPVSVLKLIHLTAAMKQSGQEYITGEGDVDVDF